MDSTRILDLVLEGLATDGGHHKQWYLEQIAEVLGCDRDTLHKLAPEYDWEDGVAP